MKPKSRVRGSRAQDKKRLRLRKLWCAGLAAALAASSIQPAYATRQEVTDAKKKASAMEQEKARVEASLKNLEGVKNDTAAYVKQLDGSLDALEEELDQLSGQIDAKEGEIVLTQQQLEEAKATETKQYDDMKLRIKYMYEQGNTSFLDMLLESSDMMQFLNRAEYIGQISKYDRTKLDEYEQVRASVETRETDLEREHQELLELQDQTEAKQQSVQTLLNQKNAELQSVQSQITAAQGQISQYEQDLKAQENKISQMEAEIKRQEEEAARKAEEARKASQAAAAAAGKSSGSSSSSSNSGNKTVSLGNISFIWPCPSSSRITSGFGGRSSPTEGASSNHQGIDIGASSGAGILAAASGTVVISTYSYSAGNYIMINHGGGVYTVYMHCSKLLVSEGQKVSQGQTIGKVGSTGYSTGPHLHFGIRSGGSYVNPAKYVSP